MTLFQVVCSIHVFHVGQDYRRTEFSARTAVVGMVFVLVCIAARGLKVLTEIRDALTANQQSAKSDTESR
jgi:hypothetical protein